MKRKRTLAGLLALNACLIVALGVASFIPEPAEAQLGGGGGEYMMVAGAVKGRNQQSGIYVLELRTQRMLGLFFNSNSDQFELIGGQDLSNIPAPGRSR